MLNQGRIELILGPMFSGKSTELVRLINRHSIAKLRCCVIKHAKDDNKRRSASLPPDVVATHDE